MVEAIYAGDSKCWVLSIPKNLPDDAKFEALLRSGGSKVQTLKSKREGSKLTVNLDPETSKALLPGIVVLMLRVTATDFQKCEIVDRFTVLPGLDDEGFDCRTEAEKCLEQAEKALADYTNGRSKVKSYTIGTRSLTFNNAQELFDLVNYWRKQVYFERCRKYGVDPYKKVVKFS